MPDDTAAWIGSRVRAEMAAARISQETLASVFGKTQPWVSRRLSGEHTFTVPELERIADYLAVPLSTFIPAERRASA